MRAVAVRSPVPGDATPPLAYPSPRNGVICMELARARTTRIAARHGGRVLADALVAQGIDHVFEVPGESFLDTLDGLFDQRQKLKLVTCRFEAGAVNMADAYGKLTGRPAAAMVTRGPGACHGAVGVHVAMQDSTPMLLFVGQIPHERHRTGRVPGSRLPPDVCAAGEMGHPDRPGDAYPRNGRPRGGCRHQRSARPGGHRPVGGNAEGQRPSPRPAASHGHRRPSPIPTR